MAQPTTRFIPHGVNVNCVAVQAWINQIESTAVDGGIQLFEETTGSEVATQYVASKSIEPKIQIATSDLTALTTVPFAGLYINPASGTPGVIVYGRALPEGSLPAAIGSSAHITCTVSDGMLIPVSIASTNNEVAKLNLSLEAVLGQTATYSSATPLLWATGATISSGSAATTNIYTGGPVKFTSNSTSYLCQGVAMSSVQFGIKLLKESTDSQTYPTQIAIIEQKPKFEFTTKDPTIIATIADGIAVSAFAGYFRNVSQNGQRVAPATATHAKISGTAGMITPGTLNLSHKRAGEASFIYTPSFDGTNAIIVVSTTAAIPTS